MRDAQRHVVDGRLGECPVIEERADVERIAVAAGGLQPVAHSLGARCPASWSGTARARSLRRALDREFLAFCGQLSLGWIILEAGDCQAKGALERSHRFVHGNFEAGASPMRWTFRPV